ncbi:hypothetical protein H6503_00310 [Candidatus Woesearchaeota archaeon]|nr:hypothetical protein [Candidatus Woesearchaeota archaeon]
MDIEWCKEQRKGIKLISPSKSISNSLIEAAQETLIELQSTNSLMWKATMKYYLEYFLLQSFFYKIGIKCEIHECSLLLAEKLSKYLPKDFASELKKDKKLRIDNQYYLRNNEVDIDIDRLRDYILFFKNIKVDSLNILRIINEIS